MKTKFSNSLLIALVAFFTFSLPLFSQQLDVLIIGSTHTFSEGNEAGVIQQKAFNPSTIASHLAGILDQDPLIAGTVNVEFEDIYKTKAQTLNYSYDAVYNFTSHCFSLAQHYMWPEGKTARLANLRGEGAHVWDYIIICNDPYIMANFPGMVTEGVKLIKEEVAKSANPAQVVLLAQWPESGSGFTADQFNKLAFRVGNSAGITVVPAGNVWNSYGSKDTSTNHPTPRGEYLAAASIYSKLYSRSAKTSGYTYPSVGSAIADHALSVIQANNGVAQYTGIYTTANPFQMKYVSKRTVSYRETGSSTENGMEAALGRLDDVHRITFNTTAINGKWDFNYGRGNDWWEDDKDYEVNATKHDRAYGFPMHHYILNSSLNTMPYGIDKHYHNGYNATEWIYNTYEDGTDLGIAYNMVRPGPPITRERGIPEGEDVRAIPIRLMWLKMDQKSPGFNPLGDNAHMSNYLHDASVSFMYTLMSGRCPVVPEPSPQGSSNPAWMQWLGHKIGYETAWQMSHLTTRVPGFRVLPSSTASTTVTPGTTQTMTVQFMYPPQSNVTVNVSCSNTGAAVAGPTKLVFTPANYNIPQQVTLAGLPGALATEAFNIDFTTISNDEIYNGLTDSWAYTNNRSSLISLTQTNNGITNVTTPQATPLNINLNASSANATNTTLIGPSNGTASWVSDGVIQYTPNAGYLGPDEIVYAATYGTTQKIGLIAITVTPIDGQVNINAVDPSASEQGPNTGNFVITRTGSNSSPLNVSFTRGGTATFTSDYTLSHTSPVTIPAGQSSVTITLPPVDDVVFSEGNETAILTITANAAYTIGTASATVTISDNDNNPPVVNAGTDQLIYSSGSALWTPALTTTRLWLDAADAATITLNGATASQWRDKSGNNRHASQSTAGSQPTLTALGLNNKSVLTFDGTNDFFDLGTGLDFLAGVSHSAFIVTKPTTFNNIYGAATSNQGAGSLHVGFNATNYRMNYWGNDYTPARTINFVAGAANLMNYIWTSGANKQIMANGKSEASASTTGVISNMSGGGRIANIVGQGYLGGDIAEMIFLTGTVSTAERETMEGYLAHKWGLTNNLPAVHPYRNNAPGGAVATANLDGTVTDTDGQTPTVLWTKISGPGVVSFASATSVDTTATFSQTGTYVLRLTADDGTDQRFDEVTITVNPRQDFINWINGFTGLGGNTASADDPDGDGNSNGVENYLGTNPGVFSQGLLATSASGNTFTFTHPLNSTVAEDITAVYRWSANLINYQAHGATSGGSTVTFSQSSPVNGIVTVTATVTGTTLDKLFVQILVTKQ